MVWHTLMPFAMEGSSYDAIEMAVGSRRLVLEQISPHQLRVVRLISTDPADYLKPDWQPGAIHYLNRPADEGDERRDQKSSGE